MSYSGSNNAVIFDNCSSLKGLIVTLEANYDLITQGNVGFSLQLNCYPQTNPQAKYYGVDPKGAPLNWFQYVIYVSNNQLSAGIQYWAVQPSTDPSLKGPGWKGDGYNPFQTEPQFGSAPSNQLSRGSVMRIQLDTDSNDNVTAAWFCVTPKDFKTGSRYVFYFPANPNAQFPIYGFQVNLVGPGNGATSTFTSGGGILTYSALSESLSVQTNDDCGGYGQPPTGENSNVVYGDVLNTGTWELSQQFWFHA